MRFRLRLALRFAVVALTPRSVPSRGANDLLNAIAGEADAERADRIAEA